MRDKPMVDSVPKISWICSAASVGWLEFNFSCFDTLPAACDGLPDRQPNTKVAR